MTASTTVRKTPMARNRPLHLGSSAVRQQEAFKSTQYRNYALIAVIRAGELGRFLLPGGKSRNDREIT
jgi:hypothetical protein